jgi:cysteine synthase
MPGDAQLPCTGIRHEENAMSKLGMLAAGAVGYVLGARAGRERYDQIVASAQRLWSNPKVQEASQQAQLYAREKAPEVGEKLSDAAVDVAKAAAVKVTEVVGSSDDSSSGSSSGTTKKAAAKKAPAKKAPAKKTTAKKSTTKKS